MKIHYDLVVLGGGSAGLATTIGSASLGARTLLIEKNHLGGDCLHYGCIPSKALLHAARVVHRARQSEQFGLRVQGSVDYQKVLDYVQSVIATVAVHDQPENFENMGAKVAFGTARLTSPGSLVLDGEEIFFRNCVIATGSRPYIPPQLDAVEYLTNETLFYHRQQPERLLVLGGGPIGCEMAQALNRLGSRVTLVERGPRLLKKEDPEASQVLETVFKSEGIEVHLRADLMQLKPGLATFVTPDQTFETGFDQILVATGRRPNTEGLGLEAAGVQLDPRGYIKVNARLRTTSPNIWAAGDVHGGYQFTHTAEHEAKHILPQVLFRVPLTVPYKVVPWATFTEPEVARVGLTEEQAEAQELKVESWRFGLEETDRAITDDQHHGFFKILTDPAGKIVGATLVCPGAGELIHEYVLAMEKGLKPSAISTAIHVYPTLALGARRAADHYSLQKMVPEWVTRLAQWLFGYRSPNQGLFQKPGSEHKESSEHP